jgi:hypothetical protein
MPCRVAVTRLAFVAAALGCQGALAQTVVPPALQVQRAAPQLVVFAGSQNNFQNLVNGLATGTPVQLVTVQPDGFTQVVTFTPTAAMSPTQITQVLETARQQLIGLGIGNPTAQQLATALMGGVVPTAIGGTQVPGTINAQNPPSPAVQAQGNAAVGGTASSSGALGASVTPGTTTPGTTTPGTIPGTVTPPVNVQVFPSGTTSTTATTASPRVNTSDSFLAPGAISRTPTPATPGTAPGANPPPGERASGIASAPAATPPVGTVTPPAAVTPPVTTTPAPPGSLNSGLRVR